MQAVRYNPVMGLSWALVLLAGAASAGPVFGDASEERLLDLDGNWPRAFPRASGGFVMFSAGGGDYKLTHADDSLTADHFDDRLLTGRTDLKDHDIRPCPDGSWLHVATADKYADHDSAYVWRYDSNFATLAKSTYAEGSTDGSNYVDVPVVCGQEFQGFLYAFPPEALPARFAELGRDARATEVVDMVRAPFATGSSLVNDSDQTMWVLGGYTEPGAPARKFVTVQYDTSWTVGRSALLTVAPEGYVAYWPQATIRVGNVYIVAHMMRDEASAWVQQEGNLTLSAFDVADWKMIDQVQLSQNVAPHGGMQPFVVFDGKDSLVALYSKELRNYAFTVKLQPEVLESVEDTGVVDTGVDDTGGEDTDSGVVDSGSEGDSDGAGEIDSGADPDPECGCASSGAGAGAIPVLLAWGLGRRAGRERYFRKPRAS